MIPRPFTRVVFAYGAPVDVPNEASGEEMERCLCLVQEGLDKATARAEEALLEESLWRA